MTGNCDGEIYPYSFIRCHGGKVNRLGIIRKGSCTVALLCSICSIRLSSGPREGSGGFGDPLEERPKSSWVF
jgi:hypothetical protein